MRTPLFAALLCLLAMIFSPSLLQTRKPGGRGLLVISVDGMDYRYLRDADRLGLKLPTLRRLMKEGELTEGIEGVYPTVTWPSHTTMITGVTPAEHGVLGNRRPKSEGGDYYWDVSLLKVKTLWHATRAAGLKSAAVTWPVTVGADIDFNLPEYFQKRNGGFMDLHSIEAKATPGLVEKIQRVFPSFTQEWMDDRTRTQATLYFLKHETPDLILLHLVDLDSEAHENGPFSREANAKLEYTDELIGQMIAALPPRMTVAVVSDHGFERADRLIDVQKALARDGVAGTIEMQFGVVTTNDEAVAKTLRASGAKYGVGRQIPTAELERFTPQQRKVLAAFESAPHTVFGESKTDALESKPTERGVHGLWPGRPDYSASFLLWGSGVKAGRKPRMSSLMIAARFAEILGVEAPGNKK